MTFYEGAVILLRNKYVREHIVYNHTQVNSHACTTPAFISLCLSIQSPNPTKEIPSKILILKNLL